MTAREADRTIVLPLDEVELLHPIAIHGQPQPLREVVLHAHQLADERQAKAEALHASIVEQVQQLADSGQWRAFLEFARSFYNYSLNNCC